MGECEVNDVEIDGKVYEKQGLLVKRLPILGRVRLRVDMCQCVQNPHAEFFSVQDMGLPPIMTPNYETYEYQIFIRRVAERAGRIRCQKYAVPVTLSDVGSDAEIP